MLITVPEPFGGALIIGRIQLGRARLQLIGVRNRQLSWARIQLIGVRNRQLSWARIQTAEYG